MAKQSSGNFNLPTWDDISDSDSLSSYRIKSTKDDTDDDEYYQGTPTQSFAKSAKVREDISNLASSDSKFQSPKKSSPRMPPRKGNSKPEKVNSFVASSPANDNFLSRYSPSISQDNRSSASLIQCREFILKSVDFIKVIIDYVKRLNSHLDTEGELDQKIILSLSDLLFRGDQYNSLRGLGTSSELPRECYLLQETLFESEKVQRDIIKNLSACISTRKDAYAVQVQRLKESFNMTLRQSLQNERAEFLQSLKNQQDELQHQNQTERNGFLQKISEIESQKDGLQKQISSLQQELDRYRTMNERHVADRELFVQQAVREQREEFERDKLQSARVIMNENQRVREECNQHLEMVVSQLKDQIIRQEKHEQEIISLFRSDKESVQSECNRLRDLLAQGNAQLVAEKEKWSERMEELKLQHEREIQVIQAEHVKDTSKLKAKIHEIIQAAQVSENKIRNDVENIIGNERDKQSLNFAMEIEKMEEKHRTEVKKIQAQLEVKQKEEILRIKHIHEQEIKRVLRDNDRLQRLIGKGNFDRYMQSSSLGFETGNRSIGGSGVSNDNFMLTSSQAWSPHSLSGSRLATSASFNSSQPPRDSSSTFVNSPPYPRSTVPPPPSSMPINSSSSYLSNRDPERENDPSSKFGQQFQESPGDSYMYSDKRTATNTATAPSTATTSNSSSNPAAIGSLLQWGKLKDSLRDQDNLLLSSSSSSSSSRSRYDKQASSNGRGGNERTLDDIPDSFAFQEAYHNSEYGSNTSQKDHLSSHGGVGGKNSTMAYRTENSSDEDEEDDRDEAIKQADIFLNRKVEGKLSPHRIVENARNVGSYMNKLEKYLESDTDLEPVSNIREKKRVQIVEEKPQSPLRDIRYSSSTFPRNPSTSMSSRMTTSEMTPDDSLNDSLDFSRSLETSLPRERSQDSSSSSISFTDMIKKFKEV